MNSMDAADIDRDGDIDLVVGEHEMMGSGMTTLPKDEKVTAFENDGKASFTPHIVDRGKESHLGTQLADLDGDGDLLNACSITSTTKIIHIKMCFGIQVGAA